MAEAVQILPDATVREELVRRGAGSVSRCYQCATCASVCALSTPEIPFPRQQMLLAQWGLVDRLAGDPAVWLCHQCTDCSERCPRDAKPGDVLQSLRATVIQYLAFPQALGKLVGNARVTWPLLLLGPWLFWVAFIFATGQMHVPDGPIIYEHFVPHWMLYVVFFPVAGWVSVSAWVSGQRMWNLMGRGTERRGSFLGGLTAVLTDVALHRSFGSCTTVASRRWGHLFLFWGFVGAAATSGLLIVGIYMLGDELPYPMTHPFKILGNVSAVLLVVGGVILLVSRFGSHRSLIRTSAFDGFFIFVVGTVIVTGVVIEVGRLDILPPAVAYGLYTVHLGAVMTLFLTFPYSKFAHMVYRSLALTHQRLVVGAGNEN